MKSFKVALTVLAAIFGALLVPTMWTLVRELGSQKQTGVGAIAGGLVETLLSPLFWILTILFFFFFLRMSNSASDAVRILFFWIPTIASTSVGLLLVAGYTYLFLHFRQH
jgi:hypothetical protein